MSVTLHVIHLQSPICELLPRLPKIRMCLFNEVENYGVLYEDLSYLNIILELKLNPEFILVVVFFFHILNKNIINNYTFIINTNWCNIW